MRPECVYLILADYDGLTIEHFFALIKDIQASVILREFKATVYM